MRRQRRPARIGSGAPAASGGTSHVARQPSMDLRGVSAAGAGRGRGGAAFGGLAMDVAHANPRPTRKSRSMPKVAVFNQVTLDGFFADAGGDMTWAHRQDEEWKAFAEQNAKSESRLLLGR